MSPHVPGQLQSNMEATEHVLCYLRATWNETINYAHESRRVFELWGWVDADLAGDTDTRRSHTGYILMMNGGPISWKSRRQNNVSLSTSEAEFVAASQAAQEAVYLRKTLHDFGYLQSTATDIYEDNLACIAMSENPVRRKFSRHIDIRRYFVRESVKAGIVKRIPLRTHKMVADEGTGRTFKIILFNSVRIPRFLTHNLSSSPHKASFAARPFFFPPLQDSPCVPSVSCLIMSCIMNVLHV